MSDFKSKMHYRYFSAAAPPQTPPALGELRALLQTPKMDFGGLRLRGGRAGKGHGGKGKGRRREEKEAKGRKRERRDHYGLLVTS